MYNLKFILSFLILVSFSFICDFSSKPQNETENKKEERNYQDNDKQNKNIHGIVNDAKNKFYAYLPKIEKTNEGKLNVMQTYTGDFTGDGLEDVAIYFTLSFIGGNADKLNSIALYKNTGSSAKVIAGFEPSYSFSFNRISEGKIYITRNDYAPDDPRCCPSIKTEKVLTVSDGKVFERDL
ncbi:MAG: hypothetical protein IT280_11420 [Ignavibacteria bacterium]|nr:hypothetical protein [Ignavibacteria bacterium]